jgi:hypothetical protein
MSKKNTLNHLFKYSDSCSGCCPSVCSARETFFFPLNVLLITNGVSAVLLNRASVNWFGGVELQHFTETMFSLDFQFSIV